MEYAGTVLVVSHDRAFLDNLCTSTLVFEGRGTVKEFVGGYSDWKRTWAGGAEAPPTKRRKSPSTPPPPPPTPAKAQKLTWKERREWEELPARIEFMEAELRELHERMADPAFFQKAQEEIRPVVERSQALPQEVDEAFARWAELDERS